jgi:thiamine biosynthesis lipoprotein
MSALIGTGDRAPRASFASPTPQGHPDELHRTLTFPAMGGRVRLLVWAATDEVERADHDLALVASRIVTWAGRLTRFHPDSDLSILDRDPSLARAPVRPILAAVLARARELSERTDGMVDVTLRQAREAAEAGDEPRPHVGTWWLDGTGRDVVVRRDGSVAFDLDGVGKGWIADRALELLKAYRSALVDADGDIAVRVGLGQRWEVTVADPRDPDRDLATFVIPEDRAMARSGIATSGTSVHRWRHTSGPTHHLIDPRTSRPAVTDVLQATVIAESALVAEGLAKAVVILGSEEGLDLLDRAGAYAELLLLEDGEVLATPRSLGWLP